MNPKISTTKNLFGAKTWRSCLRLLIALAILCGGSMARAIQSDTWVGGAATSTNNWVTTNNWDVGGSLAVGMTTNGDALTFGVSTTMNPNNNFQSIGITNIGIGSITLNTNGYAIGGNAIQITNGITDNNGANTISLPLTLGASQTFQNSGSGLGYTNTESGTINLSTNTLTIAGGAPVFLTGFISSPNGGQLVVNNGSVTRLGVVNAFGTNVVQITNLFTGDYTYTATTNIYMNSFAYVAAPPDGYTNYYYFTNIVRSTNGTTAYYTNTFPQNAEAVTVLAGTLQLNNAGALPNGANVGNIWVDGTLDLNGLSPTINGLEGSGYVDNLTAANTGIYTLTVGNANSNGVFSGVIQNITAGSVALTKTGYGTEELDGGNQYSGATTINQGTLAVGSSGSLGQFSPTLTIASGAVLDVSAVSGGYYPQVGLSVSAGTPTKPYTNYLGSYDPSFSTNFTVFITGTNNVFTYATNVVSGVTNVDITTNYVRTTYSTNSIVSVVTNDVIGDFNVTGGGAISPITSVSPGIATWSISGNLDIASPGTRGLNRVNFLLNNTTATGGGTNDLIAVGGNLSIGDELDFVITPLKGTLATGTYTLMTSAGYTGTGISSGNAANLVLIEPRGLNDTVQASGNNITLTSVGGTANAGSIIWQGTPASLNWDTHLTQDWKTNGTTIPAIQYFYALDNVIFDDTGVGSIVLPLAVNPSSMTFNNNKTNYTFTQNASTFITGTGGLVKTGSGTLTLQNPNSFTGDVTVNGGTLNLGYYSGAGGFHHTLYNGVPAGNLILGGGTINENAQANSSPEADFQNVTINPGASAMTQSGRTAGETPIYVISNNVTRAVGGTLNLVMQTSPTGGDNAGRCGIFFVNTNAQGYYGVNGILGGYATFTLNDWVNANNVTTGSSAYANYQVNADSTQWGSTSNVSVSSALSGNIPTESINSLKINPNTAYTVNIAGTLTLSSGGLLVPSGTAPYQVAVAGGTLMGAPSADLIVLNNNNTAGSGLTISSAIVDNGGATGLTTSGGGTTILTGNNAYTGPTYINNGISGAAPGTLQVGANGTSGSIASSSAIIDNGSLAFSRSDNTSVNGVISGIGSLTKLGGGVLTLTANNTLSGLVTISAGTLQLGNGGAAGSVSNTTAIVDNGTLVFSNNNTVSYPKVISGYGSLVQFGSGNLVVKTNETYSGSTTVSNGTMTLTVTGYLTNTASITVKSGALLDVSALAGGGLTLRSAAPAETLAGSGTINGSVTTAAGTTVSPGSSVGTLTINNNLTLNGGYLECEVGTNGNDKVAVGGTLGQSAGLVKVNLTTDLTNGVYHLVTATVGLTGSAANLAVYAPGLASGQLAVLTNSTTHSLDLLVYSGFAPQISWKGDGLNNYWSASANSYWKDSLGNPIQYANADLVTFDDSGSNNLPVDLNVSSVYPGVITNNSTINYTIGTGGADAANIISGGASLVKNGSGTLTLQSVNNYVGGTTINDGTVQLNGTGTSVDTDGMIGVGPVNNNGVLVVNNYINSTIVGDISGSGLLVQRGVGKLTLTGNNTAYAGPIAFSNYLQVGNGVTGNLGTGNVTNNGTLILNNPGTIAVPGDISGSGNITNTGPGIVTLGGNNTYAGNTAIPNGTIKLGSGTALPSTTALSMNCNNSPGTVGTLDLNGNSVAIASLLGDNTGFRNSTLVVPTIVNNGGGTATLTIGGGNSTTFYGQILDKTIGSGTVALVITNNSTLTLSPAYNNLGAALPNLFSGGILVSNAYLNLGAYVSGSPGNNAIGDIAPGVGTIILGGGLGTVTNGNMSILYPTNGTLTTYNNNSTTLYTRIGTVNVPAGQIGTIHGPGRGTFTCTLTGGSTSTLLYNWGAYSRGRVGGDWTGFYGLIVIGMEAAGSTGPLAIDMPLGLPNAAVYVRTNNPSSQGIYVGNGAGASGLVFPVGSLAGGDNTTYLYGSSQNASINANWAIGGLNTSTTYGGIIAADGIGIRKVGTGTLTLTNNRLAYTGQTVVSNGTLAFVPLGNYTNSLGASLFTALTNNYLVGSSITIVSPGIMDVSQAGGTLYLISSARAQTLSGNGTLTGNLFVTNSIIAPGSRAGNANIYPGQLTVSGNATFGSGSTFSMAINSTNSPIYDSLAVGGTRTINTANLTVVNNGPAFANGSSNVFRFFSGSVPVGVSGITNFTLPGVANSYWVTNLVLDGSMALVNTNPSVSTTPFTLTNSFDGTNLTLSWPLDHTGYRLQAQTNSLENGLSNNWAFVNLTPAVNTTNKVVIPVGTGNASVFYRLIYP